MSFGLDDLANFVEGLRKTFKGSSEPTRVQQNIQQGVVAPLRMGAEFSGVNQAYRGSRPDASGVDKGLALLVMAGMLGGQQAASGVQKAITPKYVYGLHLNKETMSKVPRVIKPIADAETRYGPKATPNYNAFFGYGTSPETIPDRALDSTLKWALRYYDGTASVVKAPQKKLIRDTRSPVGYKTPKKLKVVRSIPFDTVEGTPDYDYYLDGDILDMFNILDKNKLRELIQNRKATP